MLEVFLAFCNPFFVKEKRVPVLFELGFKTLVFGFKTPALILLL